MFESEVIDKIYSTINKRVLLTEKFNNTLIFNCSESNINSFYYIDDRYGNNKKTYLTETNSFFKQAYIEHYNKIIQFWNEEIIKGLIIETREDFPNNIYYYKYDRDNYKQYYFYYHKKQKTFFISSYSISFILEKKFFIRNTQTRSFFKYSVSKTELFKNLELNF